MLDMNFVMRISVHSQRSASDDACYASAETQMLACPNGALHSMAWQINAVAACMHARMQASLQVYTYVPGLPAEDSLEALRCPATQTSTYDTGC